MHKLIKNARLNLFTYLELIFAFAVNTVVISINLGYQHGNKGIDYIIWNLFAGLALFVTAMGITGIQLTQIYRKKNEIGLKRAVGAGDLDILGMVLKDTLLLIWIPSILGAALGGVFSKVLPLQRLWITTSLDYRVIIYYLLVLIVFTLGSSVIPATKAVNFNILDALKNSQTPDRVRDNRVSNVSFYLVVLIIILTSGIINYRIEAEYKKDIINTTGSPPATSELVPDFSYQGEDGKILSSQDLRGTRYCLVLYDISCPVSPMIFDYLREIKEEGKEDALEVIAVCLDGTIKEAREYVKALNYTTMPIFIDDKKATKWAFNASVVPSLYLVDESGVIRARSLGWSEELKSYIENSLVNR